MTLRLSLSRKLALAFGLALVILIVIGTVAYRDTIRLVEVTGARAKARQFLWDLEQVVSRERNAEREELGYLITGDDARLAAFRTSIDGIAPALRTLATADPSQAAKLAALDRLMALKVRELEHVVETRQQKGLDAASAEFRRADSSESLSLVRAAVDEIKEAEGQVLAGHAAEAKTTATRTFRTIAIGTVIALLLVSTAAITISRGITVPVHGLGQTAESIAAGELQARVDVRGTDEIAELGHAFNRMAEALQSQNRILRESGTAITDGVRVITAGSDVLLTRSAEQSQLTDDSTTSLRKVRDGVQAVFNASEKVSQRTEDSASQALEMQASAEEIRVSMERLFRSVASTSASITEMSAASVQMTSMISALAKGGDDVLSFVSEMDATIAELGQVARRTAELSSRVREEAIAGGGAVDETTSGIEQASEVAQKAALSLDDLQRSVSEIGRIVAVIDDVTKQTNLLALNAAIIAAQAGEHGRGFSVVADEMRNLAERTGTSTQEIRLIIESVQSGSRQAVQAMDNSVARVRSTVELARKATASLSVIVTSASTSSEMSERISKALEQQSQASRHLHEIASGMAEHFVESTRSIQEQARGAQALAEEAERVREIAAGVRRASEEQSLSGRGIALAIEQIDGDARAMRDLLGKQLQETDAITTASATMREIAQQNNVLARELTETVRSLGQSGERFEQHVRSRTA